MKAFTAVATPHEDILQGRLTMDVFAADLWEVYKKRAPAEYQDADIFFRKTYLTKGLKNLLEIMEKRLQGKGGDSVIQLQTPFGGGKTHALIALYHKAKEKGYGIAVIDGSALDPKETIIWEEIERQLTGKVERLKGETSPGKEKIREVIESSQPCLILMDEILTYATKAAGIKVGDTNMAAQLLSFMQELTGAIKTVEKSLLIMTLPSSILEHYDENAEKLFQQLKKIAGRMEKIYSPVQEDEIYHVVRRRLFSQIDESKAKEIIEEFLNYAEKEKIFPEGIEKADYRERFLKSYPFQPEVIDVLYKRWGSFPSFQRTRGVLRLLSMVVYSLRQTKIPFIRLCDFDLNNNDIRRELVNHIGHEFDSVIAQDITSSDSGAKKVDKSLGSSYLPYSFGTKVATTIFMYSFSGGPEKGCGVNEIKMSSAEMDVPSSIITEAISKLEENLFYLQSDERYFFSNQPNLNRILLTKMEGINDAILMEKEKELLSENIRKKQFEIFIWPSHSKDVPDSPNLKLIIMKENHEKCNEFLQNCGDRPRVHKNTLVFLCPMESERSNFINNLKKWIAWQLIENDKFAIKEEQKKMVKDNIKKYERMTKEELIGCYRLIYIPSKDGLKEIDLGKPTYGMDLTIDQLVYERLKSEEEILERLSPLVILKKYLAGKDFVEVKKIWDAMLNTPGETRLSSSNAIKEAIKEGVMQGLFGFGYIEDNNPLCKYFKEGCEPLLTEKEIIVKKELCKKSPVPPPPPLSQPSVPSEEEKEEKNKFTRIYLRISPPSGKLSDIVRMISYIKSKFNNVRITMEIDAEEGGIDVADYENKIEEALKQANVKIEEERKN